MINCFWWFIPHTKQKLCTFKLDTHSFFSSRLEHQIPGHENRRLWTFSKVTSMSSVWQLKTKLELVHGLNWDNLSLPRANLVSAIWIWNFIMITVSLTLNLYVAHFMMQFIQYFQNTRHFGLSTDPPGQPSAPEPLEVTSSTCDLAWKPPENDGGSPVTGYYVQRTPARMDRWIRVTRDPVPSTKYQVSVVETSPFKI